MEEKNKNDIIEDSETKVAKQVIPFLAKKKIPLNPDNFRLWFDYFQGYKEEVLEKLEPYAKDRKEWTKGVAEELTKELYIRDFQEETSKKVLIEIRAAEEVSQKASELLVNAIKEIISSAKSNSEYGDKLSDYLGQVEKARRIDEIENVLKNLLKDTAEAVSNARESQEMLKNSSGELEKLSSELEKAKAEAYSDNLTRIYNRRYFDKVLKENVEKVGREFLLSLILLDIDYFKRFNDNYGHQVGDNLLRTFARELKDTIPKEAIPCRYGGEEFAIVFPKANVGRAVRLAEEFRKNIEDMEFTVRGREVSVTVSAGVSQAREGDPPGELIERADKALYMAKYLGRNKVRKETKV